MGRLTQALALSFEEVVGVDASPTMIRLAEQLNQQGSKVRYLLNTTPTLEAVVSDSVDLLYTNIVLQHLEPRRAMGYIVDFVRVLAPGGIAVFQLPSRKRAPTEIPARPIAMPPMAYRAELRLVEPFPASLAAGNTAIANISVRNASGVRWAQGPHDIIRLGNHWRNAAGEMVVQDDGRTALPPEHSEPLQILLEVRAPTSVGDYTCEFDLVHEGVTWFGDRGSPVLRVQVSVSSHDSIEHASATAGKASLGAFPDINALLPPPSEGRVEAFPMFGVSRGIIEELVRTLGAELFQVDDDERAGPEWESHVYFLMKPSVATIGMSKK